MSRNLLMLGILSLPLTAVAGERIVGGEPAPPGEYPFFSTVTTKEGRHICGGALIAKQWVLTAAHCIRGQAPHQVQIGIERYKPEVVSKETIGIAEVYIPADYKGGASGRSQGEYDIALLKLESPARSSDFLKLEGSPAKEEVGDAVVLAGFGKNEEGKQPDELYYANGTILDDETCRYMYEGDYPGTHYDPALHVCASDVARGGDSGSPLLYRNAEVYVGLGIVSRRLIEAGQFTRISYFRTWMDTVMKAGSKCGKPELLENGLAVCSDSSVQPTNSAPAKADSAAKQVLKATNLYRVDGSPRE